MIQEPVGIFLTIMAVILITPLLSERIRLPGIVGLIIGGMIIGPYGFNLLGQGGVIEMLATVGLLYLMFSAGLEVDTFVFQKTRNKAIVFGVLTYSIPQIFGIILGRFLGLEWMGAILLGSAVASHTLIALPVISQLGIMSNEAMSVTIGATVLTDITAFLVLAIVAGNPNGSQIVIGTIIKQIALILIYAALILFLIPRAGKYFFQKFKSRSVEFQFMLLVLLIAAFSAELIGMHAVVGAFLAGLAINSSLPPHSAVKNQVMFMGESFFIPIFLMHSGMLTDPKASILDPSSLIAGIALTIGAYLTKFLAAWIAGKYFHYSREQILTVWGLSQSQAAVTIPTMLIGVELGLFQQSLFNGAIMMIIITSLTSPMIVQRFGRHLQPATHMQTHTTWFDRILVPLANPATQESLLNLAELLTRSVKGLLLPLNVARESGGKITGLDQQQQLIDRLPHIIMDPESNIQPIQRIDSSISNGILRSTIEQNASMILMGWTGKSAYHANIFGDDMDRVFWRAEVPVLVVRVNQAINGLRKVVWAVTPKSALTDLSDVSFSIVTTIIKELNVPLLVLAPTPYDSKFQERLKQKKVDFIWQVDTTSRQEIRRKILGLAQTTLLITTTRGSRQHFQSVLGREPEEFAAAFSGFFGIIHLP
ncbi:MAG: cation:proton antiporter [Chloroflexi bacterium HGW-Chloroflexi-8]|nr:MAG: cation:proton antiporter [Chloroflexi bacterium HGW-Chloroflexi-8]